MSIRTLKSVVYKGSHLYFRNFGETFEYLAVIHGEVYTAHLRVRKTFFQRLLGRDYTEKQLAGIVNYLAKIAETTVDTVLTNKKGK